MPAIRDTHSLAFALFQRMKREVEVTARQLNSPRAGAPLSIEEVAIPDFVDGSVLIRVKASGVCHTDLHAVDGDWPVKPIRPLIPGHEGVGIVAAVGRGVKSVKEGDRVGVPWLHSARGCCTHCTTGWETLCESQLNTGYGVNGAARSTC